MGGALLTPDNAPLTMGHGGLERGPWTTNHGPCMPNLVYMAHVCKKLVYMQNHRPGIMLPRCCCPGALVPWCLDHGLYCLDHGPYCLDPGARIILDLVQRSLAALDHGSIWPLVPGSWCNTLSSACIGSWCPGSGIKACMLNFCIHGHFVYQI